MFGGLDFALPATLVSVGTIGFGGLFALFAWLVAALDHSGNRGLLRYPASLYAYTASVLSVIVGMVVLSVMPYEWEQYHILGKRLSPCVFSVSLIVSFVAVVICMILLRGRNGQVKGVLAIGSTILVIVDVTGFLGYMFMHGNP